MKRNTGKPFGHAAFLRKKTNSGNGFERYGIHDRYRGRKHRILNELY